MKKIFFTALFAAVIAASCKKDEPALQGAQEFSLAINGNLPLSEMITAGNFDEADPHISEHNFPIDHGFSGTVPMKLFFFTGNVSFDEAALILKKHGWRLATIDVLLAFAEQHPELQGSRPVVALGSSYDEGNHTYSPVVEWKKGKKRLFLDRWKTMAHPYGYSTDYLFAVMP